MKKASQITSLLLHPIILPTLGTLVYLSILPIPLLPAYKFLTLFIVVGGTFLVPLCTLLALKFMGHLKTNDATTIEERKLPVLVMIFNFFFLGKVLEDIWQVRELTILAYATTCGLLITAFFLYSKIKVSLHMLGISSLLGFFLIFGNSYNFPVIVISILIVLSGALASARLHLKAHNYKEIIIGTLLGLGLPLFLDFIL